MTLPLRPALTTILLSVAAHIEDSDLTEVPKSLARQKALSPTSLEWLSNWQQLLSNPVLFSEANPHSRQTVSALLSDLYNLIKDMPIYRKPLSHLVLDMARRQATSSQEESEPSVWRILSDEVVKRSVEVDHGPVQYDAEGEVRVDNLDAEVREMLDFLRSVALENDENADAIDASVMAASSSSVTPSALTAHAKPVLSRRVSEFVGPLVDASVGSGAPSPPERALGTTSMQSGAPSAVQAAAALVQAFAQLVFTSLSFYEHHLVVAIRVFRDLVDIIRTAKCPRARLCALSFITRLRADRDHRLYFEDDIYQHDIHTRTLAAHINRAELLRSAQAELPSSRSNPEREGRAYRGRGLQQSTMKNSRSRSRAARHASPTTAGIAIRRPLWKLPERLPFDLSEMRTFSERLTSYDPEGPARKVILPISDYLDLVSDLLESEVDWEIMSYLLCFLPAQLSNKHLFCGPKCRGSIVHLLETLSVVMKGDFASQIVYWPPGITPSHASALAYHTLVVLMGYKPLFEPRLQNVFVELFYLGLSEQPFTAKCCLHALSLAAFELRPSMTRYLALILDKLAQIISNPILPVHVINFLALVASAPSLHANFTRDNFKQVFIVALRYLQDHNRHGSSPTVSWALSQHVRIMSYAVIYTWFLAVRLPDRLEYVSDIVRGLLQANEGNAEVDEPTEVCFDWLARYTFASADPRPAQSILDDVVNGSKGSVLEKTWVMGNTSVITVRTLSKLGWVEILARRATGLTKILCRIENVPLVGPGDVDPDIVSLPGILLMDKEAGSISQEDLPDLTGEAVSCCC
jgi:tuberous sclerosis 2